MGNSYKDLIVWKKSIVFVNKIYESTSNYPKIEQFNLVTQIRRSVVSVPSNIAEGSLRGSRKEFIRFLHIAYSSGAELETQLLISYQLNYLNKESYTRLNNQLAEIMKMLNVIIRKLKTNN